MNCPVCNLEGSDTLLDLKCGNFDNSSLYTTVHAVTCKECGHVYNQLTAEEIDGLAKYYNEEYEPANASSIALGDNVGDRPGSNNLNTSKRYSKLHDFLVNHIHADSRILDVGCAGGGFLDYLLERGFKNLHGIDLGEDYVSQAKSKGLYQIELGAAEAIPFGDSSMDLLVIDQVMEHLMEPGKAFQEAKRVLADGGLFCVSVPDASRYEEEFFFDFFWFLLREHVQHFDIDHLQLLASREGFELVDYSRYATPMMSEKMTLPVLTAIFRIGKENASEKEKNGKSFALKDAMDSYLRKNFQELKKKKELIGGLAESKTPVYAWGISREFLYLYETAGLKNCQIAGLIDDTLYKQEKCSVGGKRIFGSALLKQASSNSVLFISAIAHTRVISQKAAESGFPGKILSL